MTPMDETKVFSRNNIPIRLPDERWLHIVEGHEELIGLRHAVIETVAQPERILEGNRGELLAVREHEPGHWIVVAYTELNGDGFVITAFVTSKWRRLERRRQVWPSNP